MPKIYTPRRASKRWLANAPAHVLDLFKTKCGSYETLYTGPLLIRSTSGVYIGGREMSENPYDSQGVGISFELRAHEAATFRYRNGHRRVTWDSLPEKVKACIMQDAKPNA